VSAVVDASPVVAAPALPRLRHQALEMFGANALQRVTGAAGGVVAAHLLGPAGRGTYAILVLLGSAVSLLMASGLQFWVAARLAVDAAAGDVRPVLRRHGRVATGILLAVGAVAAVAPAADRGAVAVVAAMAIANAASLVLLAVPVGLRRTRRAAVALAVGGATWLIWLGLAALLHWDSAPLIALGAGVSQVGAVAVCLGPYLRLPKGGAADPAREHRAVLRAHLAPGLGELVLLGAFRVDIALVAALASPGAAGLYAVATSVSEGLWLLPDAVSGVLLPQVAAHGNTDVRKVRAWSVGATALVALPVVLLRDPIVTTVFGHPYRHAASALPWLVLAALALSSWKVDSSALVARGRGSVRLASASAALAVLVAGDLLLIPHFGIRGAAWSCMAAYGLAAAIAARAAHR
jgi:O-antigen/teichoic acid export membrane protein